MIRVNPLEYQNDTMFFHAFENAPIGMALVGIDGNWLKVNQELCRITGYSEKELTNTTFQEITHPEDLSEDLRLLEVLINGEINSFQIEKRYFHKAGHAVWVLLSVSSFRDEQGE